jgi:long-chain-fatty-acid--[acyl-carrier-protein] ligase
VVLFTSGSEKAPKAVPLTHANVLSNMKMVIPMLHVDRTDTVLGFLPLFHSFGHTVTALLPILVGIKILHHPDPTDAGGLVRKIAAYKPTLVAGTPTFMGYILDKAAPGDLDSLKLLVVGAEKCPDAIFEKAKRLAPNATVLEGYGITECAPIVSVNPSEAPKAGTIGKPLPGLDVRVLDVDSERPVPDGKMGMLEVSGPNVFPGYLGHDVPVPFRDGDGKKWYVTGDLAALDADGYIVFHGRLKRFLKAGGEMISLPALEEPFARLYPPTEEGPRVAVEGVETHDGRNVVLFTTEEVSLREANAVLQKEGFRGVMRLDDVRRVDKIPVLGTGKTDYKVLRGMLTDRAGGAG